MERLEERDLRWVLGVDRSTPGYLMKEELQRKKLRERTGKRAWGFEKRMEEGKGGELVKRCWEEIRERSWKRKGTKGWEGERRKFLKIEDGGWRRWRKEGRKKKIGLGK